MRKPEKRASGESSGPSRERAIAAKGLPTSAIPNRRVLLRTAGTYVVLVLVLLALLRTRVVEQALLDPFRTAVAWMTTSVLNLLGVAAVHKGVYILGPRISVVIANECTGLEAVVLLLPAILVFPAGWRAKNAGVVLSLGVMAVINLLRLVSLCYVSTYSPAWLEVGHLYVWPAAVIVAGLLTLLFWVERIVSPVHR